ncbi:penicillin-binding protein activator [Colwellia sp. MB02u-18]|uniref:penicillin-binding protein activator n=1 Tax=unclassified Colwellia TaxID=196834 RepID=UPI0015F6A702|nr:MULTISPECIES: penicillin-binding protein activator [unclassified Colwellia]MBA6224618.1 penicillin-binding protein activator [Colwellia sp. MB3u-45]MBA6268070.1 penicillin-binding protein activator [Colwellia sp. MB3u-43]MBA6322522.1 penicillin-binding protein activator [Colwellia sp. MB02u-19]MBA6326100.1 penicillin-binding protein activator [Colwellia sp. MB02u-18]MBA6331559.1 penicillin-binding protein activator [Colwellia sp. MB02u-12]
MTLTKWFSSYKSALCALATVAILASCSTTKLSQQTESAEKQAEVMPALATDLTTEQQLAQATAQISANQQDEALSSLLNASELYLAEAKPHKALWLAKQLNGLVSSSTQQYRLAIIEAKSLLALARVPDAYLALENANNIKEKAQLTHRLDYFQTLTKVQTQRKLPIAALDANLRAFAESSPATEYDIDIIWQQLCQLSPWQHQQLIKMSPPNFEGWSKLLSFANQFGDDDARFKRYLRQWQREFSSHPAQYIVARLRQQPPTLTNEYQNIAIIIPLSGKQERAGKVAQQGILAAYNINSAKTLHFIDSTTLDMTTLNAKLTELKIDYVIGPLLKENVNLYLAQTEITTPTLLLNLPSATSLLPHQVALSMRPEDEAIQAATTLSRQHYQYPIILSHQDSASRRIAQTFSQQWQHITGKAPEIVFFNSDAKMQNQLKASLGVDLSQQRTKDLNRHIKYSIQSELRNRRDIDMIYVVGLPLETKLLKPYIDVNISPFADIIPVYASSRSHSSKIDKSDNRDLSGLIFTEMPWQLKSKQQNQVLAAQAKKLWPNRSDSLQSIFAMGFDSLALVDKVSTMQNKTYVRHYGQTGILQLGVDNILTRSLIWGKYSRSKVQEIAMDQ